ncbi:MAG: alpha-glucan family phosphorylase [Sedimentisphaerales bacterium]|nr:alpha-glucan family phosphorylase [Sedimentisphaerales bacterium]
MRNVRTFVVVPSLPAELSRLNDLAQNLWWSWDHDCVNLFRRLDRELWEECYHNPVKMLGKISQERLEAARQDLGFISHMERVLDCFDEYMAKPLTSKEVTVYFSAEFGLNECLPIYSGGLGILAGDHLKSASDLSLNLVGVGLLYRQGYFSQYLNADGWQQESYPENDFFNMPVELMKWEDGRPIRFHIDIGGNDVVVQIWRVRVGRISLYLLDTNLRCNRIEDRQITSQLYGGDSNMRIRQEILLGIGGFTAMKTLMIEPTVCHMNEGHAAFMSLERVRRLMLEKKLNFHQAREATRVANVFTTHTPVPAGHDAFSPALMEKYFKTYHAELGISWQEFLTFGRVNPEDIHAPFSMTNLAIKMSNSCNGVSKLHGEVSRHMCSNLWPGVPVEEVPIDSVTNGIHVKSWLSYEMAQLFDRYLGPDWRERTDRKEIFQHVDEIPDAELWRTHERRRERLVAFARRRMRMQMAHRGVGPTELSTADEVLDPEVLTIGFARRFATYKRANLLFSDRARLEKILGDPEMPVQIIFAGKAHPRDNEGKDLIREIVHYIQNTRLRNKIVFLENYDMNVARYLVQGVDVWLNNPRRGMEASGTSGMKVLGNGGLNASILDGWWCEGYSPEVGWAIGKGESYHDKNYEDEVESHALYNLLENEIVPTFYDVGKDKLPRKWIKMMKESIKNICPEFSTERMVEEYDSRYYGKARENYSKFFDKDCSKAIVLSDWKQGISDRWKEVRIDKVELISKNELQVGSDLEVRCQVYLGSIAPSDVVVELYQGPLGQNNGEITNGTSVPMNFVGQGGADNNFVFNGKINCKYTGLCGFTVRVMPYHQDMSNRYETRLITWENNDQAPEPASLECVN